MRQTTDLFHKLAKLIDHNRGMVIGLLLTSLLATYLTGCQATTPSLRDASRQVTAAELRAEADALAVGLMQRKQSIELRLEAYNQEVEQFNYRLGDAAEDLNQKMQFRAQVVKTLGGLAVGAAEGSINPLSAITAILGLLSAGSAMGLGVDNLRKDRLIKKLKTERQI